MKKRDELRKLDLQFHTSFEHILKGRLSKFETRVVDNSAFDLISGVSLKKSLNEQIDPTGDELFAIVGTITPYCGQGYFYTSIPNLVYGVLDDYYQTNNKLVDLKKEIDSNPASIDEIKLFIKEHRFLFIDVIKHAWIPIESSEDKDILFYSLDYESFNKIKHIKKFICTSQNAYNCLKLIVKDDVEIEICHQDRFHIDENKWKETLNHFNNIK